TILRGPNAPEKLSATYLRVKLPSAITAARLRYASNNGDTSRAITASFGSVHRLPSSSTSRPAADVLMSPDKHAAYLTCLQRACSSITSLGSRSACPGCLGDYDPQHHVEVKGVQDPPLSPRDS